ncbi:MAG: hypothetical protein R3E12_16120 [Candidatus Eisenbacteria bacterium]
MSFSRPQVSSRHPNRTVFRGVPLTATAMICALLLGSTVARGEDMTRLWLGSYVFDPGVGLPSLPDGLRLDDATGTQPWIVQFSHPIDERDRTVLEALGAEVQGYLPDFAYLITIDTAHTATLAAVPGVRWEGAFQPAYRLSPQIGRMELRDPTRSSAAARTLVVRVFRDPVSAADLYRSLGARVVEIIDHPQEHLVVIEAADALLPAIAREPLTWYVEEKPETFLLNNTTKWVIQSNASGSTPIWDHGVTGLGEIVTLMDSGVDCNSCYFRRSATLPRTGPSQDHRLQPLRRSCLRWV